MKKYFLYLFLFCCKLYGQNRDFTFCYGPIAVTIFDGGDAEMVRYNSSGIVVSRVTGHFNLYGKGYPTEVLKIIFSGSSIEYRYDLIRDGYGTPSLILDNEGRQYNLCKITKGITRSNSKTLSDYENDLQEMKKESERKELAKKKQSLQYDIWAKEKALEIRQIYNKTKIKNERHLAVELFNSFKKYVLFDEYISRFTAADMNIYNLLETEVEKIEEEKKHSKKLEEDAEYNKYNELAKKNNGLIAYYPFNGNANDVSGNGNHGQVNGATLTTDRFGNSNKAYSFNQNYILVPHSASFNFVNFSISLWVSTTNSNLQVVLKQNNFQRATNERFSVAFNDLQKGGIQFATKYNSSNCLPGIGWQKNEVIKNILNGSFHHIVATVNNNTIKLYIDGRLVNTITTPYNQNSLCYGGDIQIGREWSYSPNFFQGKIDDIGIWNRALTQLEITHLYQNQFNP